LTQNQKSCIWATYGPLGNPSRSCHTINRQSHTRPTNCGSQLCEWAGQTCIQHTAVLYLSKFSSGLLLLHASMRYEVVKHLPCGEKRCTFSLSFASLCRITGLSAQDYITQEAVSHQTHHHWRTPSPDKVSCLFL